MGQKKYSIFDNLIEGAQVINEEWRYIYINDATASQARFTREELLGFTMMEKYPGIERTELFGQIKKCMEDGASCQTLSEFEFPDGTKGWFDLRIHRVDEGVLIMSFDVTDHKQLEAELRRLNEDLENRVSEKTKELQAGLERERELNRIKSLFVSMASHEFRTPLSTILSSIVLIEKYAGEQEEKINKHTRRIKSAVQNLTNILNDFLSLDKLEQDKITVDPGTVEIKNFIAEIIDETEGIRKHAQHIHYHHSGDEMILLDKQILRNVIFNLVSNAIKYSNHDIELTTEVNADKIILSVSDKGLGIPEEEQDMLFEKFFRATNATHIQGTGLGLHIVKRYVELMKGTIFFWSRKNEGTKFIISFPRASQAYSNLQGQARSRIPG